MAPVPGISELTLLGVDRDGGPHILHLLFSILVRPYDPDQRFFGCCGEFPPEVLPAITEIPVASFGARRAVSAMSRDEHQVHLEEYPPSGWHTMPCERESGKGEQEILSCWVLTFLPPDTAAPLFNIKGSVGVFSKELLPVLIVREPP